MTAARSSWITEQSSVVLPTRQPRRLLDEEIERERMETDGRGVLDETLTEMILEIDHDPIVRRANVNRQPKRTRVDRDRDGDLLADELQWDQKESPRLRQKMQVERKMMSMILPAVTKVQSVEALVRGHPELTRTGKTHEHLDPLERTRIRSEKERAIDATKIANGAVVTTSQEMTRPSRPARDGHDHLPATKIDRIDTVTEIERGIENGRRKRKRTARAHRADTIEVVALMSDGQDPVARTTRTRMPVPTLVMMMTT